VLRQILIAARLWLTMLLVFSSSWAQANELDDAKFTAFIKDVMEGSNTPGLSAIVFDATNILYERSFGIAGPDNRPVTSDTPFPIGSISKSFAALALLQLADEGKVNLDDPVVTYLPEFHTRNPQRSKYITVRQILSHRSGFSTLDGNRIHDNRDQRSDALDYTLALLSNANLKYDPGEAFEYSNANYMVAAALIERITESSYEAVIDSRIFQPLDMMESYVHKPLRDTAKPATGYRQWFGKPVAHSAPSSRIWVAAGGVTSSANDIVTYIRAVSNNDMRIFPEGAAEQLTASQVDAPNPQFDYALGWMLHEHEGRQIIYHSGLVGGFAAQVAFYEDDKKVLLSSQTNRVSSLPMCRG